jgi:hypothetical protein
VDTYTIIAIVLAGFQAGVAILQFMRELLALRRDVQENEDEQQAEVPKGWLLQCPLRGRETNFWLSRRDEFSEQSEAEKRRVIAGRPALA